MKNLSKQNNNRVISYLKKHFILTSFIVLALALILRIIDIYFLKLDEKLGEIILSKFLGFVLVILVVYLLKDGICSIGLSKNKIYKNISIGLFSCLAIYLIAYLFEYLFIYFKGGNPTYIFTAIDPKQGLSGSFAFMIWLLFGNLINALMEESLFRGLFLSRLMTKYSFFISNLIQSILFGLWHLVWPLKDYLNGDIDLGKFIIMAISIALPTAVMGFIWGYMFYGSKSLYLPIASHFMANSIQNVLHIVSNNELDTFIFLRGAVALILSLLFLLVIKKMYFDDKLNCCKNTQIFKRRLF